jgi:hypothetical protein
MGDIDAVSKAEIRWALDEIQSGAARECAADDEAEGAEAPDIYERDLDESESQQVPGVLSLAQVPVEDWDSIRVSPLSRFGDALWDFTSYPHTFRKGARLNFDFVSYLGVNVTGPRYVHWLRIGKALCLYSVPHFAVSAWTRSYSALASRRTKVFRLFELFHAEGLYLGDPSDPGFRTVDDLPQSTVEAFIDGMKSCGVQWELAFMLQFWQRLSKAGLLPAEYGVHGEYVAQEDVARYRAGYDAQAAPFAPIPLDDYAEIVNYCMRMVTDYSADILWLYETYYPTIVGGLDDPERQRLRAGGVSTGSAEGVEAFSAYTPVLHDGDPWWPLRVLRRAHPNDRGEYISYSHVAHLVASLIDACCTLILATTGMRRSEAMGLRSGCVSEDDSGYWLTFTVFKTSPSSQGDVQRIPIPEVTARAVFVLERLCADSRRFGEHDYLFSTITRQHFGNRTHDAYPERAVKRVAEAVEVDSGVHPHRFRKSLAMYMIYQDPRNIELIRQLFSHKSLKMTLRYILSLPGVHDEIKTILIDQNVDVLTELLDGVLNDRIGGVGGQRVKATAEKSPVLKAKLQDSGKETLIQYVESVLDQGITILHRTNLAICLKTPGVTESAPCDGKHEGPAAKLHPNLFACDPFACRFAAFVESHVPALKSEIEFHHGLTRHPYCGDRQRAFSERRIKEAFKRLAEVTGAEAEAFLAEVVDGPR